MGLKNWHDADVEYDKPSIGRKVAKKAENGFGLLKGAGNLARDVGLGLTKGIASVGQGAARLADAGIENGMMPMPAKLGLKGIKAYADATGNQEMSKAVDATKQAITETPKQVKRKAVQAVDDFADTGDGFASDLARNVGFGKGNSFLNPTKENLGSWQSDAMKASQQARAQDIAQDNSIGGIAKAYLTNPYALVDDTATSVGSMVGGGKALNALGSGKALNAIAKTKVGGKVLGKLGGAGAVNASLAEGVVAGGMALDEIKRSTDDKAYYEDGAMNKGLATIPATMGFALLGNKIGAKLGIADVDELLVAGAKNTAKGTGSQLGRLGAVAKGAVQEGLLEEMPQGIAESAIQNWATGKPLTDGMAENAIGGAIAGGLMGGGMNAVHYQAQPKLGFGERASDAVKPKDLQKYSQEIAQAQAEQKQRMQEHRFNGAVNNGAEKGFGLRFGQGAVDLSTQRPSAQLGLRRYEQGGGALEHSASVAVDSGLSRTLADNTPRLGLYRNQENNAVNHEMATPDTQSHHVGGISGSMKEQAQQPQLGLNGVANQATGNLKEQSQSNTTKQAIEYTPQEQETIRRIESTPNKGRDMAVIGRENFTPNMVDYVVSNNRPVAVDKLAPEKAKELGFEYPDDVRRTIHKGDIEHTLARHGKNSDLVKKSGQKPVTKQHIANWTKYADRADVTVQSKDDSGNNIVISGKQINGYYAVVEQVRTKRNELSFKTMYFQKGNIKDHKEFKDKFEPKTDSTTNVVGSPKTTGSGVSANGRSGYEPEPKLDLGHSNRLKTVATVKQTIPQTVAKGIKKSASGVQSVANKGKIDNALINQIKGDVQNAVNRVLSQPIDNKGNSDKGFSSSANFGIMPTHRTNTQGEVGVGGKNAPVINPNDTSNSVFKSPASSDDNYSTIHNIPHKTNKATNQTNAHALIGGDVVSNAEQIRQQSLNRDIPLSQLENIPEHIHQRIKEIAKQDKIAPQGGYKTKADAVKDATFYGFDKTHKVVRKKSPDTGKMVWILQKQQAKASVEQVGFNFDAKPTVKPTSQADASSLASEDEPKKAYYIHTVTQREALQEAEKLGVLHTHTPHKDYESGKYILVRNDLIKNPTQTQKRLMEKYKNAPKKEKVVKAKTAEKTITTKQTAKQSTAEASSNAKSQGRTVGDSILNDLRESKKQVLSDKKLDSETIVQFLNSQIQSIKDFLGRVEHGINIENYSIDNAKFRHRTYGEDPTKSIQRAEERIKEYKRLGKEAKAYLAEIEKDLSNANAGNLKNTESNTSNNEIATTATPSRNDSKVSGSLKDKIVVISDKVADLWVKSLGLKSLNDEYIPKIPQEVQDKIGKQIKVKKGSLLKLITRRRTKYIPEIKPTFETPDTVIKDKDGLLFIKQINDDTYFVNVNIDKGDYWVSISQSPRTIANIENKFKAGAEVLYRRSTNPKTNSPTQPVQTFTDFPSSANSNGDTSTVSVSEKGSENNPTKRIQQLETQLKQLQDEYNAFRKGELYEANNQRNDAQADDYKRSTPETRKALKLAEQHWEQVSEKDLAYRQKGSAILQELHNLKMANDTQYKTEQDKQQRKEQERVQRDKEYLENFEKQKQQAQAEKQAVIDEFLRAQFGSESTLQAKKASAVLNKTQEIRLPDETVFTGSRADFLIKMAQDGFHSEDGTVRVKYDGKVSNELVKTTKHASLVNEDGDTYKITNTERAFFDWYVQSGNLKQQKSFAPATVKPATEEQIKQAVVTPKRQASNSEQAKEQANAFLRQELINKHSGLPATVHNSNLRKMISNSAAMKSINPQLHALAIANVDELYQNAIYGWRKTDRDNSPDIAGIHRLFATLRTEQGDFVVKMTVKEYTQPEQNNALYTVEALEVETQENSPAYNSVKQLLEHDKIGGNYSTNTTGAIESLIKNAQEVNAKIKEYQRNLEIKGTENSLDYKHRLAETVSNNYSPKEKRLLAAEMLAKVMYETGRKSKIEKYHDKQAIARRVVALAERNNLNKHEVTYEIENLLKNGDFAFAKMKKNGKVTPDTLYPEYPAKKPTNALEYVGAFEKSLNLDTHGRNTYQEWFDDIVDFINQGNVSIGNQWTFQDAIMRIANGEITIEKNKLQDSQSTVTLDLDKWFEKVFLRLAKYIQSSRTLQQANQTTRNRPSLIFKGK